MLGTRTRDHDLFRDASVEGAGLQAEFRDEAWSTLRDVAYEGRGG